MIRKVVQDILLGPSQIFNSEEWLKKDWFRHLKRSCYFAYKNFYEKELINFVEKNSALLAHGHVVDVGANIGFTAKLLSTYVTKPFSLYAFEPEKWNFKILEENVKKNALSNVIILPWGLGEVDSRQRLWINPKNSADHRVLSNSQNPTDGEIVETVIRNFDSFWEEKGFERISFIKMDIQGYELFALKGMQKAIQKYRPPVLIELDNDKLSGHSHTTNDIYNFFSNLGYCPHKINSHGQLESLTKDGLDELLRQHEYLDIVFKTK